ncbi:glutathione S-transferase family protein [Sphaerospermopsis sp. LEGE 00249]|jgi:glutathione S-transferase|uniref:glutathione S-transferase family protein n=1 Tax=Sphaerospermopsis sp. LEGE 00249 TaxID=1380707 RepID=UPI00164E8C75|nr:glutathione S-transferase family protein [Sphaerospermopsis sp. LEGE 00249]MBC5797440.1 glutathione S-transferase family protein [Sphaerospermopsis sp. LEGE 00249]
MITLYYSPIHVNPRRVWITLIEKGLKFELVEVKLINDEQFKPEFLAINPFHHIPVLVDDGLTMVESLAILDYLEAKYPNPPMLPKDAKDLAIVQMVQHICVNEILPAREPLMSVMFDLPGKNPEAIEQAKIKVNTALKFFENLLDYRPFFGSNNLTLGDVVAGTLIPWLPKTGISFNDYPKLTAWCDRLVARPAWQATQATPEMMANYYKLLIKRMG